MGSWVINLTVWHIHQNPVLYEYLHSRGGYVQDKVRPGTGREGALGYVRYIAGEHMDVRRDCVSFAQLVN